MKISRNQPCPCGSGKKFKKCCINQVNPDNISLGRQLDLKGKNAENFVYQLAKKSFLTDWCYKNPKLKNGKEICDLLVVYDDVVIIWQIKDLKLKDGKFKESEVKNNLKQLLTAKNRLFKSNLLIELDNPRRGKEIFNPKLIKEVFFISALIGNEEDYCSFSEEVKGIKVHVFTREFTEIVLNELDTIKDFIGYLREKEKLFSTNKPITILNDERELLAFYLMNERKFDRFKEATYIVIQDGIWDELIKKPEYIAKKLENKISYAWDEMIDMAHTCGAGYELVARELARPDRFERRILSKSFFDAHMKAHNEKMYNTSRRIQEFNGVTYCFMFIEKKAPREKRKELLQAICFAARGRFKDNKKVIGIATEMKIEPVCSYDFCFLELPQWSEENQKVADMLKKNHGILENTKIGIMHEDEYPQNH